VSELPEGWEIVKLENILTIKYGKNQKNVEDSNGKYPILGTGGLMGYANSYLYNKASVLIGRKGTIDKPQYINKPFWTVDTLFYTDIKNNSLPKWVYYRFLTIPWKKYNEASGVPSLSVQNIHNIQIPLPPLAEQKKIANILSTVDEKIALIDNQIEETETLKKGLMQKLLTEGIGHGEFKDSDIGRIPVGWDVVSFIELADKNIKSSFTGGPFGSDLKSEHYTNSGVRIIQLQNIGDGSFINNDFVYTSNKKAEELKSCQIFPNDIILAKMAEPVARACIVPNFEKKFIMCSDGIRLKVDNTKYDTKFIFYFINHKKFRDIAIARSTGTTRQRIGLSALKTIPISIPPLAEQKQIAQILSTTDDKLEILRDKKESFQKLKKGLMQKLLTGEVRVRI
jgi:type I restriction enzyme S subunit